MFRNRIFDWTKMFASFTTTVRSVTKTTHRLTAPETQSKFVYELEIAKALGYGHLSRLNR